MRSWASHVAIAACLAASVAAPAICVVGRPWLTQGIRGLQFQTAAPSVPPAGFNTATSGMPAAANDRIYQRMSLTGGSLNKGQAPISVPVTVTSDGQLCARLRDKDTSAIVGAVQCSMVTTATTNLSVQVDARLGWEYVDLSGDNANWVLGTVPIGAGDNTFFSGQSLTANGITTGGTPTLASLGLNGSAPNSAFTRIFAATAATPVPSVASIVWSVISDASANYKGAMTAKYLLQEATLTGVNQGIIGYGVGGSYQSLWQQGGTYAVTAESIIAASGSAFRTVWWFQGHEDGKNGVTANQYRDDLAVHATYVNSLTSWATPRWLVATIPVLDPIGLVGAGSSATQYGFPRIADGIVAGARAWTLLDPSNRFYVDAKGMKFDGGGVHPDNTGGEEVGLAASRAGAGLNTGPYITSASRLGGTITANMSQPMTTVGNWWERFGVYVSGTQSQYVVQNTSSYTPGTSIVTLVLDRDPGVGQAVDVKLGVTYEGDGNTESPNLKLIRAATAPSDGDARAPAFLPSSYTIAALTPGGSTLAPATVVSPNSWFDLTAAGTPAFTSIASLGQGSVGTALAATFTNALTAGYAYSDTNKQQFFPRTIEMFFVCPALGGSNAVLMNEGTGIVLLSTNRIRASYANLAGGSTSYDAPSPCNHGNVTYVSVVVDATGPRVYMKDVTLNSEFPPGTTAGVNMAKYSKSNNYWVAGASWNGTTASSTYFSRTPDSGKPLAIWHISTWSKARWTGTTVGSGFTEPTSATSFLGDPDLIALHRLTSDGLDSVRVP